MIKLLGFLVHVGDRLYRKVSEAAWQYDVRRQEREDRKRQAWLRKLDPKTLRSQRDLGSIILARQAEVAQGLPLREGMTRKGGINRLPTAVISRPDPPGRTH